MDPVNKNESRFRKIGMYLVCGSLICFMISPSKVYGASVMEKDSVNSQSVNRSYFAYSAHLDDGFRNPITLNFDSKIEIKGVKVSNHHTTFSSTNKTLRWNESIVDLTPGVKRSYVKPIPKVFTSLPFIHQSHTLKRDPMSLRMVILHF